MNLADTLRGLWRRWYIVVPGLILTIALGISAWQVINPDYERVGAQVLLPGLTSIPEAGNPYLYLGGLSQASDVLITAMSSERELDSLVEGHPGAEIVIRRDPLTSGPQILTTVTAHSDAEAGEILSATVERTTQVLRSLQDVDGITAGNRIGIKSISIDKQSTLVQKTRVLAVVGATLGMLLITLLLAGLVEGLSSRKRRSRKRRGASLDSQVGELSEDDLRLEDDVLTLSLGKDRDRRVPPRPLSRRWRPIRRVR